VTPPRALRSLLPLALLIALALAACAPLAPARAEIVLDVVGAGGAPVPTDALDDVALVVARRLADAGIPAIDATRRDDHVVVRFGAGVTDADLAAAEEITAFSSEAVFRPVLLAGSPSGGPGEPTPSANDAPAVAPLDASDLNWITPALQAEFDAAECTTLVAGPADAALPLIACQDDRSVKYLLGPAEIDGSAVADATFAPRSTANGVTTGEWAVTLRFDAAGTEALAGVTTRLMGLTGARNQFAVVLDGDVLIAPAVNTAITDGNPEITGGFDEEVARILAARFRLASLGIQIAVSDLTVFDD
jgi:preprotein translocase subunit SecD